MTEPSQIENRPRTHLPEGLCLGWLVSLILFLTGVYSQAFPSDLGCWTRWFFQMSESGFKTIHANYPPVVPTWIYIGSKTLGLTRTTPGLQLLIKFWMQIPIWFAWMVLVYQVATNLSRRGISPLHSWVFWLTACNPAILLDGPMWGQVDLITWIPLSLSLYAFIQNRAVFGSMLFILSLCFKFQAISVSPVFAALWLRALVKDRRALWAIPASAIVMLVAFLPFIMVGRGIQQAGLAFWGNIGMYPAASNNAANLWRLLSHDSVSSLTPLFQRENLALLTPKNIGLALFALASSLIFATTFLGRANSWGQIVTASFCFFAFCPEMHERYLFLAVPAAAVWASSQRNGGLWYAIATFVVGANIIFLYLPRSNHEWEFISLLICVAAIALLVKSSGISIKGIKTDFFDRRALITSFAFACFPILWLSSLLATGNQRDLLALLPKTSIDITELRVLSIDQKFMHPLYKFKGSSESFKFNDVSINSGIKVHALSIISYDIPAGNYNLSGRCGPERVANDRSQIRCRVTLGNLPLWESESKQGRDSSEAFNVNFSGPGRLDLIVDPEGTNFGDHALWGDVSITKTE
jgi:Gpi18-like mannosyltransferase